MLVELASDMVSSVSDMAIAGEYRNLHAWLQPLFIADLKREFRSLPKLAEHYESQLGASPYEEANS